MLFLRGRYHPTSFVRLRPHLQGLSCPAQARGKWIVQVDFPEPGVSDRLQIGLLSRVPQWGRCHRCHLLSQDTARSALPNRLRSGWWPPKGSHWDTGPPGAGCFLGTLFLESLPGTGLPPWSLWTKNPNALVCSLRADRWGHQGHHPTGGVPNVNWTGLQGLLETADDTQGPRAPWGAQTAFPEQLGGARHLGLLPQRRQHCRGGGQVTKGGTLQKRNSPTELHLNKGVGGALPPGEFCHSFKHSWERNLKLRAPSSVRGPDAGT